MKQWLFLLLSITLAHAVTFQYRAGVHGSFDSNIGQNYREESGYYIVPELGAEISFNHLGIFTDLLYDFHVTERDFDDNSPFVSSGLFGDFKWGKLSYTPTFQYELYLADNVFVDGNTTESSNWVPVIQEYYLINEVSFSKKRKSIALEAAVSYQDWADNSNGESRSKADKEGWYLTLEPEIARSWKVRKDDRFKMASLSAKLKYEQAFPDLDEDSYYLFKGAVKSKVKLFYPELALTLSYGKKSYLGENEHPVTEIPEKQWKRYIELKPAIEVPIIKPLTFSVEADFDLKRSNFPDDEFNRIVVTASLVWNGKVKR